MNALTNGETTTHTFRVQNEQCMINIGIIGLNISGLNKLESVISIVSGLMFIGLQTHLKNKLNYITHEHPFRIFQFTEEKNIENTNENSHSWKDVFR